MGWGISNLKSLKPLIYLADFLHSELYLAWGASTNFCSHLGQCKHAGQGTKMACIKLSRLGD